MRVTIIMMLACLLAGAYGGALKVGYLHPLQVEEVQQKGQTQVAEVQQEGQTQVEKVQQEGQTQVVTSEEEHDDLSKDPNWVPTDDDYAVYEEDRLEDYDDDSDDHDDDDDDDGYEYDLEDENELWLSDDDPDWVPEEDISEQQEEASEKELLLLQIAKLIQANAILHPDLVHHNQENQEDLSLDGLLDNLRSVEMSEFEFRHVLNNLLILAGKNHQEANEISQKEQESQEDQTQGYQTLPGYRKGGQGYLRKRSPRMTKRHVQTQYEVQQQGQYGYRPGQVTTQNQQQGQDYHHHGGYQQGQGEVDASQLSQGVEPLVPSGGHQHEDLGDGVEPEQGSSSHGEDKDDGPSLVDLLRYGWGYARDVAETVGDKAQEAASEVIDKVQDAAQTRSQCLLVVCTQTWWYGLLADLTYGSLYQRLHPGHLKTRAYVQDPSASKRAADVKTVLWRSLQKAGEGISTVYQAVRGDLRRFKAAVVSAFARFGTVVQEGLGYCIDRLTHSYHQVQGMQVLEKLEKKLSEGNERVVEFFNMIGQKVSKWKEQQVAENVDGGLLQGQQQAQAGHHTEGQNQDIEQVIPDLFQDDEVLIELNKLVEVGVLTQEDMQVITQQEQQQGHQQEQQEQQQGQQQEQQDQQQGYQQEQQQGQQQEQQDQRQGYQQEQQDQQQGHQQEQHHGY